MVHIRFLQCLTARFLLLMLEFNLITGCDSPGFSVKLRSGCVPPIGQYPSLPSWWLPESSLSSSWQGRGRRYIRDKARLARTQQDPKSVPEPSSSGNTAESTKPEDDGLRDSSSRFKYYLTQFLTGHGYFKSYLNRMGKTGSPDCIYCPGVPDDAEHTFFRCPRWERPHLEAKRKLFSVDTVCENSMEDDGNWDCLSQLVRGILLENKPDLDREVAQIPLPSGWIRSESHRLKPNLGLA